MALACRGSCVSDMNWAPSRQSKIRSSSAQSEGVSAPPFKRSSWALWKARSASLFTADMRRIVRGSANDNCHCSTILGPGLFIRAERIGPFLAIGYDIHAGRVDTKPGEVVPCGIGATLAEREIVIPGAALVAMTLDRH